MRLLRWAWRALTRWRRRVPVPSHLNNVSWLVPVPPLTEEQRRTLPHLNPGLSNPDDPADKAGWDRLNEQARRLGDQAQELGAQARDHLAREREAWTGAKAEAMARYPPESAVSSNSPAASSAQETRGGYSATALHRLHTIAQTIADVSFERAVAAQVKLPHEARERMVKRQLDAGQLPMTIGTTRKP